MNTYVCVLILKLETRFLYVSGPDTCTTIDLKHYFSFLFYKNLKGGGGVNFFRGKVIPGSRLGLSTSCSRFSKTFPAISLKVAQTLVKKQSNFVTEVAQKLLEKTKTFFGLILKYANCTTKVIFLGQTESKEHTYTHPWRGQYLTHGHSHITMLMSPNEGEAATAWVIWLCARVRYWPVGGLVKVCPLL